MAEETAPPVAGWYPDPERAGEDRWWNGSGWSDHRRPAADAASEFPGSPVPPAPRLANQPYPYVVRTPSGVNAKAVIGLVVSLSTFLLPVLGINGIVGAILGGMGLAEAKRRERAGAPGDGRAVAIAAIVIGVVSTVVVWILVAALIAFVGWAVNLDLTPPPVASVA